MKYILILIMLTVSGAATVSAYDLSVTEVSSPHEIVSINTMPVTEQVYLGELNDFPVMYEFTTEEPFKLTAQVSQLFKNGVDPLKFSLMIVQQNEQRGGVTEIARFNPKVEDWQKSKDSVLAMTFWEGAAISEQVEPGVYRIEVSSPENIGQYSLTLGSEEAEYKGYFKSLGQVRVTQKFFGYPFLKILTSSLVYYLLGIIVLLLALHQTWKYRQRITHVA